MNKRSLVFAMIFSSIFGGIVALVGYSFLNPKTTIIQQTSKENPFALTNYVFDSSDFIVPEGLNFVFSAKKATPSVVHIRTTYIAGANAQNPFNDFFKDYFGDRYNRDDRQSRGAGSGVVISSDGYIITNNHVIENASNIEVVLNDNRSYKANVIGVDKSTDLAVIKIEESNLQPISYGSSENIQIGEWVLAIGNPFEFRSTVTAGIISAKARNIQILQSRDRIESFIQTDAAVNPGNSGGALVNLNGELIGINTAIASPSGAFAGYSFAVPSTLVKKVVNDLIEYGAVQRALLGIQIINVDAQLSEAEDLGVVKGVYVARVGDNSAASIAGMKEGDVIIAINDVDVNSVAQLQEQVAVNRPGDEIEVTFIRDNEQQKVMATLRNSSGTTEIVEAKNDYSFEGATFVEVSPALREQLDINGGVQVSDIRTGKWKEARLKEGFIITEIDDQPIRKLDDLISFLEATKGDDGILIEGVYPNGDKAYYGMGL
ncbi:MAG: Do family serine endopeptidase [Bacteroidota bacterium]